MTDTALLHRIRELATKRKALILAHSYQEGDIQDVADFVGDSLGLSQAARDSDAELIVFCGVYFMAETAKILKPNATVLIPDPDAGCSLCDSITLQELLEWKAEHPTAVTVGYVNTTAEIKAELDYCCTSSNAVNVIKAIEPHREILFLPDMFLGSYVQRVTGRTNMHIWAGECHVHAAINMRKIEAARAANPGADLLVHPECGCSTTCMYHQAQGDLPGTTVVTSTEGMVRYAVAHPEKQRFIVATENGILHRLNKMAPGRDFVTVSEEAICKYMKMITPEKLLYSLEHDTHKVEIDPQIMTRARTAIDRMVAITA